MNGDCTSSLSGQFSGFENPDDSCRDPSTLRKSGVAWGLSFPSSSQYRLQPFLDRIRGASVDILKNKGKIKYALIILGKISYGNCSLLYKNGGIFLIIHWKLGFCKNRQICRWFSSLATILLLNERPACAGFIGFPSNLLVTNKNSVMTVRGTAVAKSR